MAIWNQVLRSVGIDNPKFSLVRSPAVSTPLTVGLLRRKTRAVLPEQDYSREELWLILHHEIIHIARGDTWNKFFMAFCTAMRWFNPLIWISMRKSADDFELNCDETVLENATRATRLQYADLLLRTAGDERGFTTCLSASARAMRYRLRCVTKPPATYSGAIVVGVVLFLLCMTCGCIALGYDSDVGEKIIYQWGPPEDCTVEAITMKFEEPGDNTFLNGNTCKMLDEGAFHDYLSGLTLYRLAGNYSFDGMGRMYTCELSAPHGEFFLKLFDQGICVMDRGHSWFYYLPEGLNWDYLETVILEVPPMMITTRNDLFSDSEREMSLKKLWKTVDGERLLVFEEEAKVHGMFCSGGYPSVATFHTPYQLAEPCTVLVEHWNHTREYSVTMEDLSPEFELKLAFYPAHYTVFAKFYGDDGTLYEAEYAFDIGPLNLDK